MDTRPPTATLRWLQPQNGLVGVEWEASDYNLDPTTLRVDYRVVGGDWIPLPVKQTPTGQYFWNPGTTSPIEARIKVQDKAHNPAEYKTPVYGDPKTGMTQGPGAGTCAATASRTGRDGTIMVNTKRIELNFKIDDVGSSKVKAVEVWYTQDGRTWQKTPDDAPPEPPYVVKVPAEGRYGFTLIARSGVGLALPAPKTGDPPQVWVEVDETKPKVSIVGVGGRPRPRLRLHHRALERHRQAHGGQPHHDFLRGRRGRAVGPVAADDPAGNVPNDGRYVWRMPDGLPPQILVRVEAIDQAGNIGQDETAKPVSTDLSIPKARVIEVHPARSADTGAMPPP